MRKTYPLRRPATRGECANMPRPCPFVSCRYHLAHEWIAPQGCKVRQAPTDDEAVEMIASAPDTCSLDIADRGGIEFREMVPAMRLTKKVLRKCVTDAQEIASQGQLSISASEFRGLLSMRSEPEPFDMLAPGSF